MTSDEAFVLNMVNMVTDSVKEMSKNGTSQAQLLNAIIETLAQRRALILLKSKHIM